MTSNLYQTEERQKKIGFLEEQEETEKKQERTELTRFFRPEFLNRIDEQIVFRQLGRGDVEVILDEIINELFEDIKARYNVNIRITKEAKDFIIHNGYDPRFGVRDLRRTVEKLIQVPLSNLILSNKIIGKSSWVIDWKNGDVVIMPE
jgi:ATP-dependent Clp protease ATP-binding subunit ClpA